MIDFLPVRQTWHIEWGWSGFMPIWEPELPYLRFTHLEEPQLLQSHFSPCGRRNPPHLYIWLGWARVNWLKMDHGTVILFWTNYSQEMTLMTLLHASWWFYYTQIKVSEWAPRSVGSSHLGQSQSKCQPGGFLFFFVFLILLKLFFFRLFENLCSNQTADPVFPEIKEVKKLTRKQKHFIIFKRTNKTYISKDISLLKIHDGNIN